MISYLKKTPKRFTNSIHHENYDLTQYATSEIESLKPTCDVTLSKALALLTCVGSQRDLVF